MAAHARLSASGAHRWVACPGSVKAEDGIAERSSPFAEEGTRAHDLAERTLLGGGNCSDYTDDVEMADYVQSYVDYVRASETGGCTFVEMRVDFSDWVPEGFGTSDAIVLAGDEIRVIDLKYGKGVRVDAEENLQGILYALGAFNAFRWSGEFERVRISIVQPRIDHISEWTISVSELMRWGEILSHAAEEVEQPDPPRRPGEKQCRFCKAKATCPALMKMTEQTILSEFDEIDPPAIVGLGDDQLRLILERKKLIEAWLAAVETHVKERIAATGDFPGYKLVEGRSSRKWADDYEAEAILTTLLGEDMAYDRKLISPAQAEKALGKKRKGEIDMYVTKSPGSPTLVPDNDPRPAIGVGACDFESIAGDE